MSDPASYLQMTVMKVNDGTEFRLVRVMSEVTEYTCGRQDWPP